jgi:hypothetical protein
MIHLSYQVLLVLGRWILLFPPGGDQSVGVVHLVLKYLWKQFQSSTMSQDDQSLSLSLFVTVLKLFETDSFSICLHAKVDEVLSLVLLILARGVVHDNTLNRSITVLNRLYSIDHLWSSEKNFVDSLMKHHHPATVLGLAVRTGLMDSLIQNMNTIRLEPKETAIGQIDLSPFIAVTSLWLSFLFPFSRHSWIKYLCAEVSCSIAGVKPIIWSPSTQAEEPTLLHMKGSNRRLKLIQESSAPCSSSIDNWCLVQTSQADEALSIREQEFSLEIFESCLLWIAQTSLDNSTLFPSLTFEKNIRMVLHQSLHASQFLFNHFLLVMKKFLVDDKDKKTSEGLSEMKSLLIKNLLPTLKLRLEASVTGESGTLCTIVSLLEISFFTIQQISDERFSFQFFQLIEATAAIFRSPPDLVVSETISGLIVKICECFKRTNLSDSLDSRQVLVGSIVGMVAKALTSTSLVLNADALVLITRTIFEIISELSRSPDTPLGHLKAPLLLSLTQLHFNERSLQEIQIILRTPSAALPTPLAEATVLNFQLTDQFSPLDQLVMDCLTCLSFSSLDSSILNLWLSRIVISDDDTAEWTFELDPTVSSLLQLLDLGCKSQLRQYATVTLNAIECHLHDITRALMWDVNWCVEQYSHLGKETDPALWVSTTVDLSAGFDPSVEAEIDLRRCVVDAISVETSARDLTVALPSDGAFSADSRSLEETFCQLVDSVSVLSWIVSSKANDKLFPSIDLPLVPSSGHSEAFARFMFHHFFADLVHVSSERISQFLSVYSHLQTLLVSRPSLIRSRYNLPLGVVSLISSLTGSLAVTSPHLLPSLQEICQQSNRLEITIISLLFQYRDGRFQEECHRLGISSQSFVRNLLSNWFIGWLPSHEILLLTQFWLRYGFKEEVASVIGASLVIHALETSSFLLSDHDLNLAPLLRSSAAPRGSFQRIQSIVDSFKTL